MARTQMNKDEVYVYMFEEDYKKITRWVLRFPDLQTGGSLFGLWKNHESPIANFVLGPGKGCKRTNVSFYQDISYLEKVGNVLTHDYMLCHIGEWHSHHRRHLYEPSSGDVGTVVRNYPRGACGFVLIIANIVSPEDVSLSPYLFTEETCKRMAGPKYRTGQIVRISGASPFQNVSPLCYDVLDGEETYLAVAQIFDKIKITEKRPENIESVGERNRNLNERGRHFQPYGSDPLGATEVSAASPTDSLYVKSHQWYSTPKGQEDLKLLINLLSEVADGQIEMTRNHFRHDLEITFLHHGTKCIIEFSPSLSRWGTKLKQERYNTQTKVHYIASTTLQDIAKEVIDEIKRPAPNAPYGGAINNWSRH